MVCNTCNGTGKVLNRAVKGLVPCPSCVKQVQDDIKPEATVPLYKQIGFERDPLLTEHFDYDIVNTPKQYNRFTVDSINNQRNIVSTLHSTLSKGVLPDRSYVFDIGTRGSFPALAYPLMVTAKVHGISVAPLQTTLGVFQLTRRTDIESIDYYSKLCIDEVVVVLIDEGSSSWSVAAGKSLMQARAIKQLPTIFVSTGSHKDVEILTHDSQDPLLHLATPVLLETIVKDSGTDFQTSRPKLKPTRYQRS